MRHKRKKHVINSANDNHWAKADFDNNIDIFPMQIRENVENNGLLKLLLFCFALVIFVMQLFFWSLKNSLSITQPMTISINMIAEKGERRM